jgi:hypothetical protein
MLDALGLASLADDVPEPALLTEHTGDAGDGAAT